MVQEIWGIFVRAEVDLFASEDNSHCQTYFLKEKDALAHDWPNLLIYVSPPITLIPQVIRRIREQKHRVLLLAMLWRNQHWFAEMRPPLSGERKDLAPQARTMAATSLASRWEPLDLPESVLNIISQARAPSMRRLYALKWSVFSAWCTTCGADPVLCDISLILSFLLELLEKSHSTFHAQGLCSSYSSLTQYYRWPISGQEQPGSFLEGV